MTMGNGGNHPLAAGTAPPQARHFGIDTCFVKEHDPADPLGMGREPGLTLKAKCLRSMPRNGGIVKPRLGS